MFKWMAYRLPLIAGLIWVSWIAMPLISCAGKSSDDAVVETFPETCAEAQEAAIEETGDRPANGTYTLYINGDETMPWDAYCHNMSRAEPQEYITVNEDDNYSQIGDGTNLAETSYRRYRIDPVTLTIDPLDDTFATSNFEDFEPALPSDLESIPAGWAEMQPVTFNSSSAESNVSLADTAFVFDESILENDLADFFCKQTDEQSFDYETEESLVEVQADLTGFRLVSSHINSMGASDAYSREIADCANLEDTENLTEGAWPLVYAGE